MQEYVTGRHSVSKKNGFRRFQAHRFVPSSAIGVVVKTGKPVFLMGIEPDWFIHEIWRDEKLERPSVFFYKTCFGLTISI